jgi:hypothetical protein
LCTIAVFGTILVARQPPRWPHRLIAAAAFGAMLFLFISKYFFGHPVMAPIGRDLAFWLGTVTWIPAMTICLLVIRKGRRQQRARQVGAQ